MIRQHPIRVLGVILVIAVALLLLSAPGANDTHGTWYYLSAFGWYGFVLTALLFVIMAVIAATSAIGRRRNSGGA